MVVEVVRRLTLRATSTGIDEQTGKLNKLADASTNVAQVTDTNAKRALSAEAAFSKLTSQIDETARSQAAIEKGTKTLNAALAQGVITQDQYNQSLGLLNAKYSDVEESSAKASEGLKISGVEAASVTTHIAKAAAALYAFSPAFRALADPAIATGLRASGGALAAMSPVLAGVVSYLASGLLPLISRIAAIALPLALLRAEIDLIGYAWQSAGKRIEEYNKLNTDAANTGVSAEFLQRQAKGFEAVGLKIDDATASLKKFTEVSQSKLGGSDLDKKLNAHLEVGNVSKGGLLSVQNAEGVEGKYRAITALLTKMADEGKKLAALDIGATFLSPATLEGFRKSNDYLTNINQSADKIAATKLISQEDINDAVQLQNRYDAAVKILSERWIPFQETITAGGMVLQRVWVGILETLAGALTSITNFAGKISELIGSVPLLSTALQKMAESAANTATFGLYNVAKQAIGGGSGAVDSDPMAVARSKLANGLSNSTNRTAWATQGAGISDRFRPDNSKSLEKETKAAEEYADAVDRAISSINKHIEIQKADAASIGLGVEVRARLKVEAQQLAAVQANGGKITAEQAAQFDKLKTAAGDAALSLEKAKISSDISRGRQLAFATPEDIQIANQLKGLYGDDIPAALASTEAAALRMNNTMKDIGDTIRDAAKGFTKDFLGGLMKGEGLMKSLQGAAKNLSSSLMNSGVNDLFSGNFISAGLKIGGSLIASLFGGDDEEKKKQEEERRRAAEEAERKRQAGLARQADFLLQAQLSGINTNTTAGQIQAFDLQANKARADEMKAGGEAILELEKLLAAQRQDIVEKANKQVLKSYRDFLDSIKTGSLSTLSPEDQLKFAQSRFNSDVTAAQSGDADAINRVTQSAQSLLDIAKSFYASSTGYTDIYELVTNAITALSNASAYTASVDPNIIKEAPKTADSQFGSKFGGGIMGNAVDELVQAQIMPGMPGYASGGFVANGIRGRDSVRAALAGGEHVTRTSSVNASTASTLQYINKNGRVPGSDNSEVVRVLTQGFNGQTQVLSDKLEALAMQVKRLDETTRQTSNQRRVPGSDKRAA